MYLYMEILVQKKSYVPYSYIVYDTLKIQARVNKSHGLDLKIHIWGFIWNFHEIYFLVFQVDW